MTDIYDYSTLLKTLRKNLPKNIITHERFQLPELEVLQEGKNTIFKTFKELVEKIDRDPQHFSKYLLKELGTAGSIQNKRLVFKGRIPEFKLQKKVDDYIKTYVLCYECESPDTEFVKEGRVEMLKCKECGAIRPVNIRKDFRYTQETIEEGKIYEIEITDISRDGNGIATKGGLKIYIPTAKKGEKVKIKIEKIKKNVAFGRIV